MTVYVDDMYRWAVGQFGRMKMSHMLADSTDELLAMARRIGVDPKWIQHAGENGEHIDIALSKRAAALAAGAIAVTHRQSAAMNARRRVTGTLGTPADALDWFASHIEGRRQ